MTESIVPETQVDIPPDVLIANEVSVYGDQTPEGAVMPDEVSRFVDGQSVRLWGREILTKLGSAWKQALQGEIPDERKMSPPQITLIRAALERRRDMPVDLTHLYQRICDAKKIRPDYDDRDALQRLATELTQ